MVEVVDVEVVDVVVDDVVEVEELVVGSTSRCSLWSCEAVSSSELRPAAIPTPANVTANSATTMIQTVALDEPEAPLGPGLGGEGGGGGGGPVDEASDPEELGGSGPPPGGGGRCSTSIPLVACRES